MTPPTPPTTELRVYSRRVVMTASALLEVAVLAHSDLEADQLIARNAGRGDYDRAAQDTSRSAEGFELTSVEESDAQPSGVLLADFSGEVSPYEPDINAPVLSAEEAL
ncbi:hypothetical protein [Deinococcus sp.]|uniref:hypothetical protein n=1 Tax=Deinococcus sp. TaxID=47478 RepID=UPI0025BD968E|nr:hypothetical protein [Deinococcus sp.]